MKKQTIKLNESQLRNMIKKTLNELDWKTYANAAKKQADADGEYKLSHDKPNRAYKFNLAASNEFNKKYSHNGNYTDDFTRLHANEPTNWGTTELPKLHLNACDSCDDEHGFLGRNFDEKDKPYLVNNNQCGKLKQVKKIPPKTFERHPELMQKFKDAEEEMEHYYNGDYDYTPEKGWHLKESRLNNIIKGSINRVFGEAPIADGKQIVKLNESQLINVIKKIIKEELDMSPYDGYSVNVSNGEDNNGVYGYVLTYRKDIADSIMRNGFQMPKDTPARMYGPGIYIFPDDLNRLRKYAHAYGNIAIRVKIISNNFQTHPTLGWEMYIVPNPQDVIPVSVKTLY